MQKIISETNSWKNVLVGALGGSSMKNVGLGHLPNYKILYMLWRALRDRVGPLKTCQESVQRRSLF